jgi:hypothetical protein
MALVVLSNSGCGEDSKSASHELSWVVRAGGIGEDTGQSISNLAGGASIISGTIKCDALFGEEATNQTTIEHLDCSADFVEPYAAKYNLDGSLAWAVKANTWNPGALFSESSTRKVHTFSDESFLISGQFQYLPSDEYSSFFVARYNSDATPDFSFVDGSGNLADLSSVDVFEDNSILVVGTFFDTISLGHGGANTIELTSSTEGAVFFAKYNEGGELEWAKAISGDNEVVSEDMFICPEGSILMIGSFQGQTIFGQGEVSETVLETSFPNVSTAFLAKYNNDGTFEWANTLGKSFNVFSHANKIDGFDNCSVIVSGFSGEIGSDPSDINVDGCLNQGLCQNVTGFMTLYDYDGTLVWVKQLGLLEAAEISTLIDGSFLMAGGFSSESIEFGVGQLNAARIYPTKQGEYESFIVHFAADGSLKWVQNLGNCMVSGMSVNSDEVVVITGSYGAQGDSTTFENTIFGPGQDNQTKISSAGDLDIFMLRLDPAE